jgi:excisionase family DNA binding protein
LDRLLSPEQAAEMLGCHRTMIFEMLARGDVASIKLGRLRRIPASSIDKYIASRLSEAEGSSPDGGVR